MKADCFPLLNKLIMFTITWHTYSSDALTKSCNSELFSCIHYLTRSLCILTVFKGYLLQDICTHCGTNSRLLLLAFISLFPTLIYAHGFSDFLWFFSWASVLHFLWYCTNVTERSTQNLTQPKVNLFSLLSSQ